MENTLWWIFFGFGATIYLLDGSLWQVCFFHKRQEEIGEDLNLSGVSVIIAAKNEAAHLNDLIPLLMEQDYPIFEVLVVNDCSTDESEDLLRSLSGKYDKLKIVNIRYTPNM